MGDRLKYERFIWFHNRVISDKYPNARSISEKFEISPRTAQRDIEFIRDRLGAPLDYEPQRKGYTYSDRSYELPSTWFSEDSVVALSLAVRLASSIPDTETKQKLSTALDTIFNTTLKDRHRNLEELTEKISVKNIEYSRVNEKLFSIIVNALFNNRSLAIAYYSPHSDKSSQRTILPLHLMQYMGNWHVIAFCALRKDIRDFALSRIKYVSHGEEKINPSVKISSIKEYTRKQFGIIQRGKSVDVRLRFSPSISAWMKEQIWHPEQKVQHKKDGSLIMEFPVADFRELKRRILSYGADVKVIAPKGLAREIQKELDRMNQLYRRK